MEIHLKRKIKTKGNELAYFTDIFEPTYRRFRLIRSNGERGRIKIHNLKMHRKYVRYLDYLKATNPSLHWLSTTKIRALEDRMKNVFIMYDNRYPEEVIDIWKTGKMPFILLTKKKDKIIYDVKVCKLYTNRYDADVQALKLLKDGMVVRTEYLLEGNFEYYKDETISGEEFRNIPLITNELKTTISCNIFHYYYARHDPAEYDEGYVDYDISYLKEAEQLIDGEEKIRDIREEILEERKELDTWKRAQIEIVGSDDRTVFPKQYKWKGETIVRNLTEREINIKINNTFEVTRIMQNSVICNETHPRACPRMSIKITEVRETTDPTLSTALSITKHIDLHASRRYIVIARKGSGKTNKSNELSKYFEVIDSDLYGIWLKGYLEKRKLWLKPTVLKEKLTDISDVEVNENIVKFYEYSKTYKDGFFERYQSIFRGLADGLLDTIRKKENKFEEERFNDMAPSLIVGLSNMINQYLGLPKIGIGIFMEVISAIKDSTKPLLIFMHSTEESGFIRTPDFTFSMPDVFDSEEVVKHRKRGMDEDLEGVNYGELLLYYTYLEQTSTIQPFIPFPVLMSWLDRIGYEG